MASTHSRSLVLQTRQRSCTTEVRSAEEEANSSRQRRGALHAAFPGMRRHPQDPGDGGKAAIRSEESERDALSRVNTAHYRVQVQLIVFDTLLNIRASLL